MTYKVLNREDFQKYLKTVEIIPSSDETAIDNFNSSSLFDLYGLLTEIKDDRQISLNMQQKLRNTLKANYPKQVSSLLNFPVTVDTIHSLEEYIKNVFLSYIKYPKRSKIPKAEIENLKIIVAKKYPDEFLKLKKEKKQNKSEKVTKNTSKLETPEDKEFKLQIDFLQDSFLTIIDEYTKHTKNMKNNIDIQTGFYTTFKNMTNREVTICTTGRKKSFKTTKDNIEKEFRNALATVVPSDIKKGITYADIKNNFKLSKISDDFYAFTAYTKGIDNLFHVYKSNLSDEEYKTFLQYRKQKSSNVILYHSLTNFLQDINSFSDFTQEEYLQMKIQLLDLLQHLTFPNCSEEYSGPLFQPKDKNDIGTSFSKLLETSLTEYNNHLTDDDFEQNLSDDEHIKYQKELLSLLEDFHKHIYDKYEFHTLKIIIPQILKDKNYMNENILRDQLDVKQVSTKIRLKRNGYCAIYAIVETPDGRKIEIQFQTGMRYWDSKIGNSDHSKMKPLDISHFFELKEQFKGNKHSDKIFKDSIHILDNTTLAEKNKLLSASINYLSQEQKIKRHKIETAQENLQIKEYFVDEHVLPDGSHLPPTTYTIEQYLPIFAKYHSPELIAVSSAHSRANKNTASVMVKTLVDNFKEVLLKTDETTCLADMLLNRLKEIQKKDSIISIPKSNLKKILMDKLKHIEIPEEDIDEILSAIQKNSSKEDIKQSYINSVSDIKARVAQSKEDAR